MRIHENKTKQNFINVTIYIGASSIIDIKQYKGYTSAVIFPYIACVKDYHVTIIRWIGVGFSSPRVKAPAPRLECLASGVALARSYP